MGSYIFRWPHDANEVFVTGTFDDWGKTVKLKKKGTAFEKEVQLPTVNEKIQYKFVVDGAWTTDKSAREEDDGSNNINNILLPEEITITSPAPEAGFVPLTEGTPVSAVMAGVAPDSTTAALAADVPKESEKQIQADPGIATIFSAAPESTTAELAKDVPREKNGEGLPGSFPETPAKEPEQLSVNPIPASNGIGNPVQLTPGEEVPESSTITANTLESTVTTDKAGYERDASAPVVPGIVPEGEGAKADAFSVPPVSNNLIPESSLPMDAPPTDTTDPGVTIQSAGPASTTAALAAGVPLEPRGQTNGKGPASDVPEVVKESLKEAHQDPEAAARGEAVEEKKEFEEELLEKVKPDDSVGEPAPTASAATTETAPAPTTQPDSGKVSPKTTPQPGPSEPTVTTGVAEAKTTEVSEPKKEVAPEPKEAAPEQKEAVPTGAGAGAGGSGGAAAAAAAAAATSAPQSSTTKGTEEEGPKETPKEKKKKNRASGFFSKLKEKFK